MARKGTPIDDLPNVEFYNTTRIKRKKIKNKGYKKMINKNKFIYKMDTIIKYLKNHNGYNYKLYNCLCPKMEKSYSNIVEYAENVLYIINLLISNK